MQDLCDGLVAAVGRPSEYRFDMTIFEIFDAIGHPGAPLPMRYASSPHSISRLAWLVSQHKWPAGDVGRWQLRYETWTSWPLPIALRTANFAAEAS